MKGLPEGPAPRPVIVSKRIGTLLNFIAAGWLLAGTSVFAQSAGVVPPQNVLQLQASGTVEVQQDLLSLSLSTTRAGAEPGLLQSQLKTALDAALAEARKAAVAGQMDVRTGNFSLYPRHGRDGKISGWNGSVEMVLEGRDFARITQAAGRIQTMTMNSVSFGLSREQRARVEGEAQSQAIERFKARAAELAKGFGFTSYTLREIAVMTNDQGFQPRMARVAMAAAEQGDSTPVPVEAGKSVVMVTVSGSVQLR